VLLLVFHESTGLVGQVRPPSLRFTYFPAYSPVTIVPLGAVTFELLTASFAKTTYQRYGIMRIIRK